MNRTFFTINLILLFSLLSGSWAEIAAQDKTAGEMPLMEATRNGDYEMVRFIIEDFGTTVNDRDAAGNTALTVAAEACQSRIAQLLLEKGADVNAANTRFGATALNIAAGKCDDQRVLRVLLDHNADLEVKDVGGDTPLLTAAKSGNGKTVEMLLDAGANVNEHNQGYTALMIAARRGHAEIVTLLINRKADINSKNQSGKTALSLAMDYDQPEIVNLLRGAGAKEAPHK